MKRWMMVFGCLVTVALTGSLMACGGGGEGSTTSPGSTVSPTPVAGESTAGSPVPSVAATKSGTPSASPKTSITPTTAGPGAGQTGEELVQKRCTACHSLDRVRAEGGDVPKWMGIVTEMVAKGAKVSRSEMQPVVRYLAETYPGK